MIVIQTWKKLLNYVNIPSIIVGGCSSHEDIKKLFLKNKNIAAGCSSIFIFKGKLKAVLISYPSEEEKKIFLDN